MYSVWFGVIYLFQMSVLLHSLFAFMVECKLEIERKGIKQINKDFVFATTIVSVVIAVPQRIV